MESRSSSFIKSMSPIKPKTFVPTENLEKFMKAEKQRDKQLEAELNLSSSKRALVEKLSSRDASKEKRKKWQNEQKDEDGNTVEVDTNSFDFKAVMRKKLNKYLDPTSITIFNDS